jgi:hypothetical protein
VGKACRQRWRALALVIKAKLDAVESDLWSPVERHIGDQEGRAACGDSATLGVLGRLGLRPA